MIRYSVFYIYGIIYVAAVDLKISKHEGNDQSVNLALDTIVEFDNKNNGEDIKFLDNVQKFIGKVKTVIVKKNMRRNFNGVDGKKFTDFILSLIQMVIKFEDSNLEDFFTITGDEFKKYHYKGCKFYELIENYDLRKFLANKLDKMKHTPADVMRRSLKTLASKIEEEKYDTSEKELIDYINSLYGQSSIELFNNFLGSLDDYGLKAKRNIHLSKIISTGIRSLVFDYYTELNRNARMALKTKLNEFFERTIGITINTNFIEENKKSIITAKESSSKPKYVEQYLDLRNYAFRYGREKLLLSSISVSYKSKKVSNFYNFESHDQKIENDAEIVKPGKKQNSKAKNGFKHFTQPYYEKERTRIKHLISYKHSKTDKKNKRQTHRIMHPAKASIMDQNDKPQSHKFKKIREHSHVTPKEPEIKNSNLDSNEFISYDPKMRTSKRTEDSTTHEQVLKDKKEHLKYKYNSNITSSRLLRGKPSSDSETDSKYDVEPTMNRNFNQQPKTNKNKLKTSHKLSKVYDTDNSVNDDKVVSNVGKIPDEKLRTVDELQINQSFVKKPKSPKSKDISLSKTTEPESIEIVAFDDLQGIDKGTSIVKKSAQKLQNKVKIKSLFERNIDEPSNTRRTKFNKLTFMTLYPEFIQKWSASEAHTKKQTIRFQSRNTQIPHRITKTTSNVSYNIRAKQIETPAKTPNRQLEKPSWNRKAITKMDIFEPEVSEAKHIRRLILREKLKSFRHPLDVTSKVNNKRRNDLSSDLFNSDEITSTQEITEELKTKTPYQNSINNAKRSFFIDLNVAQSAPVKELKVVTNGRRYDPNMNKYKKSRPQKLSKNINDVSDEKLLEKKLTSIESSNSKDDIVVNSYKTPTIKNLVLQKTQDLNGVETDKNDFDNKNKRENLNLTRFNRIGNKFKKYSDQKFQFDVNKYRQNLTRKLFIDLQNTEVKNSGMFGLSNERNNNFIKKSLTRPNPKSTLDIKKDTRRMINEQDVQTKTNAESDKKLNNVDLIQNYRDFYNEYTSTVRRKKMYFSYLNDDGKTDGYDLFYKQGIARASKENSSTIKNLDITYIPVTREPEKVTQFLEGRKNIDKKSFKDIFHIDDKSTINQTSNNLETNKLNNDIIEKDERNNSENKIDEKEKNNKNFMANRMKDPGVKLDKSSHTDNFIQQINENIDSLRSREDSIEINSSNTNSIDDSKFRSEELNANKLNVLEQSVVSTKVTETNLNIQRRAPANSNVKEVNIITSDFKERLEATESNIKSSTIYIKPIAVTITTEKIPISTINFDTKQSKLVTNIIKSYVQEINDIKKSTSSGLTTKNTFRNNQNSDKTDKFNQVKDKNDLHSNKKYITDVPKVAHHIKTTNTTLSYFNITSDKVSKLI